MPNTSITIDGVDVCADYSCQVSELEGLWAGYEAQHQSLHVPRRMGELLTAADPVVAPRDGKIKLLMRATSVAQRLANEDAIAALGYGSTVEIIRSDLTTRALYGRLTQCFPVPRGARLAALVSDITIGVRCLDPLAYEVGLSTYGFGSTRTAMPGGNTPWSPRTIISNTTGAGLTNFTLTQRNAAGDVVATMVLTGTLASGDELHVEHALMSILKKVSNVFSTARSWLTSGTYFVLRPGDTLEVDKGSGSAFYWKSYF